MQGDGATGIILLQEGDIRGVPPNLLQKVKDELKNPEKRKVVR